MEPLPDSRIIRRHQTLKPKTSASQTLNRKTSRNSSKALIRDTDTPISSLPYQPLISSDFRQAQEQIRIIREKQALRLIQPLHQNQHQSQGTVNSSNQMYSYQRSRNTQSPNENMQLNQQPSVLDIPLPTQDLQEMKYAEKLIIDNQNLEHRFKLVCNQLQKVQNEAERMSRMHGEIYQQTRQCELDIESLQQNGELLGSQQEIISQKHQNEAIQERIEGTDQIRIEAVKKLRFLQQKREHILVDLEKRKVEVQEKFQNIKDIEAERVYNQQKLDRVERQIQSLHVMLLSENRILSEDQSLIDALIIERDTLMEKVVQLNQEYQNAISEYNKERECSYEHAKSQRNRIAIKVMFSTVQNIVLSKKQQALNSFFFYCKFDEKCHRALTQLATILEKCGRQKVQSAKKKWYQVTFEPLETLWQQQVYFESLQNKKLLRKVLNLWQQQFQQILNKKEGQALGFLQLKKLGSRQNKLELLHAC